MFRCQLVSEREFIQLYPVQKKKNLSRILTVLEGFSKYYINICNDCHFFAEEGHLVNLLTILLGIRETPQDKYVLSSPIVYVTNNLAVFSFDIILPPVHPQMLLHTCCRLVCFVTELTRVPCKLLLRDFCKAHLWKFTIMRSLRNNKSGFGQIHPSTDVTSMLRL